MLVLLFAENPTERIAGKPDDPAARRCFHELPVTTVFEGDRRLAIVHHPCHTAGTIVLRTG